MEVHLILFLITLVCVIITDVLGFFDEITPFLSKLAGFKIKLPKPFNCSGCQNHWLGLIYLLATGQWTIGLYVYILALTVLCPVIYGLIINLREIIGIVINIPMTFFK